MARHETEALWALASGELEEDARARVEAHVAGCPECARRLVEARETRAVLREARGQAPTVRWAEVDDRVLMRATQRFARLERRPRWPWVLAAAGACAVAVLVLLPPRPAMAPSPAPEPLVAHREEAPSPPLDIQVEGEASAWVREADGTEQALQPDTGLRAGTSVRTPAQGSARLRLPDASRMQVAAESEVVLSHVAADDVRLRVVRGRIAVRASHAERRGFVVEAAGLRAVVVGTVFSVEHTPHGAAVSVQEGKVRVEAEGQPPQVATAGQRVELRASERTWRHQSLSAQDRRAFEALGVRVEVPKPPRPTTRAKAPEASRTPPVSAKPEPRKVDPWAPPESASPPVKPAAARPAPLPPSTPEDVSTPPPELEWQRFPAPREVEERFLHQARAEMATRTCESYLVGLEEIAEQSKVHPFREEARYLRARCFEVRFRPNEATAEYRLYLRDFPRGRWAREARVALLP